MKFVAAALSICCLVVPTLAGGLRRNLNEEYAYHHLKITVTNLAPEMGTCQTPVWVGIHDGRFDMFNQGSRASEAIEGMAEDGDPTKLSQQFSITRGTIWEGNVGSKVCAAEETTLEADIKVPVGAPYFLSYASMVLPSNDAFLANPSPRAYKVLNNNAKPLTPVTIVEMGSDVWDAGTEVNDELPMNTAFLNQTMPNTGVNEWNAIRPHQGFNPVGSGGILDNPMFVNADFTQPGYEMMKIVIEIKEKEGVMHMPMDTP